MYRQHLDGAIDPICVGSNDSSSFLVLLSSHTITKRFDLRFHLGKSKDRNLNYNRTEEVIRMVMRDVISCSQGNSTSA
jgi:hypothetical protein